MKIGDDVIVDLPHGAGWPEEQVEANARLIAAAPKLLEALQLILEHVDPEDNYIAPDTNWMRDLCREAIAEATGEPV
jgi:hypothetical protein